MPAAMKRRWSGLTPVSGVPVMPAFWIAGASRSVKKVSNACWGNPHIGHVEPLGVEPGHVHLAAGRRDLLPTHHIPHHVICSGVTPAQCIDITTAMSSPLRS